MSFERCIHGVMVPSWSPEEGKSPYCTGCTAPYEADSLIETKQLQFLKTDRCPRCGNKKKWRYTHDWSFNCGQCQFNEIIAHEPRKN